MNQYAVTEPAHGPLTGAAPDQIKHLTRPQWCTAVPAACRCCPSTVGLSLWGSSFTRRECHGRVIQPRGGNEWRRLL